MPRPRNTAVLLIHCQDSPGLIARVTGWIQRHGGNILDLDEHVDQSEGLFCMRVEWGLAGFSLVDDAFVQAFDEELAGPLRMHWQLQMPGKRQRMAIFVTKQAHCIYDLLARWQSGELDCDIPLVISNHRHLERVAQQFGVRFECLDPQELGRTQLEQRQQALLEECAIDLVVLARYMQIVSAEFLARWHHRVINIHHSFLPAFPGARPYHSALERGVKLIGATAHYVTKELDAGPIIEQEVTRVSHRDDVHDLIRKGRDLEQLVLARAVHQHLSAKVLTVGNRTVVFD
ncbi:MAG: formyltetrahydrofolate deformylase [Calditrichaeota bacterium]|nr:formyltetrahydrofolate deformylase [Candidatus Cloacimonadota bacterium]MCB1047225.1 formyltetrahydrofolate deformylase [Calditrichota bacterium]MCB9473897.1 formyltetrahydrofolate deformylase [Candidatus Delongbacteria bacterium]